VATGQLGLSCSRLAGMRAASDDTCTFTEVHAFTAVVTYSLAQFTLIAKVLSYVATGTYSRIRRVGLIKAFTGTGTYSRIRRVGLIKAFTGTGTYSRIRRVGLIKAFTATGTYSRIRRVGLIKAFTGTGTYSRIRRVGLIKVFTGAGSYVFSKLRHLMQTMSYTSVGTYTFLKSRTAYRAVLFAAGVAYSRIRRIGRFGLFNAAPDFTPTVSGKVVSQVFTYIATGFAQVRIKVDLVYLVTLTYIAAGAYAFSTASVAVFILGSQVWTLALRQFTWFVDTPRLTKAAIQKVRRWIVVPKGDKWKI